MKNKLCVFLTKDVVITVSGSLAGSQIGVSLKNEIGTFTSDYKIVKSNNEAKLVKDMGTGIETMSDVRGQMSDVWYDLNGRRLEMKPATKGVYINNGRKVVIK